MQQILHFAGLRVNRKALQAKQSEEKKTKKQLQILRINTNQLKNSYAEEKNEGEG